MHQPMLNTTDFNPELNPYVGRMANRLVRSFTSEQDTDRWALVTEVLGFAAEAEQKLSEQQMRIKQLESLASTDELTGIANRRSFDDFMRRTLASSSRYGENGVLAFLDLNRFKDINDTWGHEAGNAVLIKVARLLTDNIRSSDFAARLSGDEFAVVLTHCDKENGRRRMEKLLEAIDNMTVIFHRTPIKVSASCGLVVIDANSTMTSLMEAADQQMYRHKRRHKAR